MNRRSFPFFQTMALVCLAITLIGFAPTFFLRELSDRPPLPVRLIVHGTFCTAWVLLFGTQAFLIRSGRVHLHRRLGIAAATVAAGVVVTGLVVLHDIVQRYSPADADKLAFISAEVWGNLAGLLTYALFVGVGILLGAGLKLKARPEAHKRLLLIATIGIMGQPLVRIGHQDAFRISDSMVTNDAIYGLGGVVFLYLLVAIHDIVVRRRPHAVVILAFLIDFGLRFAAVLGIRNTAFGQGIFN